ncbi:unnamed protein product [Adineta steineri]|uniref:Uncharacterized protein n=1 Tax=Adineta steineri TaxID=433720 RepID=A0A813N1W7_9BILA|nr:unnamed protein product [Adineta steineri]CAF1132622.1 unnamed protein product [Adineta steineri]CAF1134641.1 unnamed protein product [Adineta steineri]
MGTFVFQALSTFCALVDQTISNSLTQFYSNQYVSASVTPSNVFQLQTDAFISQFKSATAYGFLLSLAMIRKTTQSNALLSGQFTNYRFHDDDDGHLYTKSTQYGDCVCSSLATCVDQYAVVNYPNFTDIFPIPGLYTGCYIIESLLQSSLQCFYDQACIDNILLYLGSSTFINVTALNISLSIQYLENSTISDILDKLMVEEWSNSSTYENYYSECQPAGCSYSVMSKNSVIYIVTTLIGLVGGLITVLKLTVPMLVKDVRELSHFYQNPVRWQPKRVAPFNIFPSVPPTIDEYQLRNQHISTRLFIFLLIVSLSILLLYTSLIHITQTVNVKEPSITEYKQLYNSHSETLTCECTQISINYEKFIQIQYTLNQICHSDFVKQEWINYLATSSGNNELDYIDFRVTSTFTFQALSTFCALVNQTILNRLSQFNSTQYVSASIIPSNVFQLQTDAFISQFKSATRNEFLLSLAMIRNTTQSNNLLSGELNNFEFYVTKSYGVDISTRTYDNCACDSSSTCILQYAIYDLVNQDKILFVVPGLYTGCYIIESLLQSDLQCFYNQTCINKLQSYFQVFSLMNITALDISLSDQFSENSTIGDILNQLMVEEWINSSIYENYYNECKPSGCSYTVTTKNSAIYIITTLIGLVGVMSINERVRTLYQKSKVFFLNLNLFPSVPPTIDEYQLRNQRISTRLFIFSIIILLSILLLYTSLIHITQTVNVKEPSITEYKQLYNSHSETLTCECTQISINYEKFIQIQYTLHQVCHSDFVKQDWINYVESSIGSYTLPIIDFRATSSSAFQALSTLCALVDQTISNRLIQFYSNQYVSASIIPSNVFQLQTDAFISQFISSTTNGTLLSLAMIRNTTQSNSLFSGELTNYRLYESYFVIFRSPKSYGNCTCDSSGTCISQSPIYDLINHVKILFVVPGLYTGCYIIESLLQSDLQCFYNQTCINKLQSYFQVSSLMNVTALNISLSIQFSENSTIGDILNQLMVEEWINSSIYENYYSECQPSYCSYTVTTKNSVIYIITTLIGLVGGLITVLKLTVPYLVKVIMFCITKCKRRSATIMPIGQT